jgi:hypothetical protein
MQRRRRRAPRIIGADDDDENWSVEYILRGRRKLYTHFLPFYLPCLLHDKIVCAISDSLSMWYDNPHQGFR